MTSTLLALAATIAAPALKDKPPPGPELVGEWVVASYIVGGKEAAPGVHIRFTGDGSATFSGGLSPSTQEGTYTINVTKFPAEVNILFGESRAEPMIGIVKMEGDNLILCFGPVGSRPTKFESPEGSKFGLLTLKRATK